jgi:hypothetical protein
VLASCLGKEMLVSSQLDACGPPYSLALALRDLLYAKTKNTYMMQ